MAKGNARGIFKLKEAYEEQLSTPTNWTTLDDAWVMPDTHQVAAWDYGYYCSGNGNTRVDRLDYTADTEMTTRAYTYGANYNDGGLSSPSAGYMWATANPSQPAYSPSPAPYYNKINYSDDTVVLTPNAPISVEPGSINYQNCQLAVGNVNYGYTLKNQDLWKFDYSNDTASWADNGGGTATATSTGYGAVGNPMGILMLVHLLGVL